MTTLPLRDHRCTHKALAKSAKLLEIWSGRRGSNPRHPAWEVCVSHSAHEDSTIYKRHSAAQTALVARVEHKLTTDFEAL